MHLDDIERESAARADQYLSKIKVIRHLAHKIIDFLAQIEDFQKMLWLKKKFVVETNYCIRLDRVPEDLYAEIAANDAQWIEWVELNAIEEATRTATGSGNGTQSAIKFLNAHPALVLDTRYFSTAFTSRLLSAVPDLHQMTDGVLVHGENFQALSLLQTRYRGQVKCVYIDPPYNTGQDGFAYKDNFKSSSWATMINSRLELARKLLLPEGVLFASINEIERATLDWQLREVFGAKNRIEELIWVRDTVSNNAPAYSTNHEYIEVFGRDRNVIEANRNMFRETREGFPEVVALVEELNKSCPPIQEIQLAVRVLYQEHRMQHVEAAHAAGISVAEARRSDPWKGLYPYRWAEYRTERGELVDESQARDRGARIWVFREVEPSMPAGKQSESIKDPTSDNFRFYTPPHRVSGNPCKPPKRGWAFPEKSIGGRPSFEGYCADNRIVFKDDGSIPQLKYFLHEVESVVSTSVIRQYADGEPQLEALFGEKGLIDNPKPPGLIERIVRQITFINEHVVDYFAGSGTTAHAVINLNRRDGKGRKFVLVEVGDYFDTVLLPRVKKVAFAPNWQDGRPRRTATQKEEVQRAPRIIKVIRLESYEDSLNNLELKRTHEQGELLEGHTGLREDYLLHYMLDVESQGSGSLADLGRFEAPFHYTLNIAASSAGDPRVTLNSFVVSVTPHRQVGWWGGGMSEQDFEDHHIFFREAERLTHIKKIFLKVLPSSES